MAEGLQELARRAAGGDLEAFRELVEAANKRLFTLACHVLGDAREAEDATQEAWLRADEGLWRFQPSGDDACLAWLRQIVLNVCRDWLRRRRASPVVTAADVEGMARQSPAESPAFHPPDELAADRETVRAAIAVLPLPYREVVALRFGQDLSYAEIAVVLALNERTVATRLRRALERLKTILGEEGEHGPAQHSSE